MGQSSLCAALAKNTGWGQGILWFLDLHVSGFGILRFQKQYYFSFDICIFTGRVAGGVNGEKFRCQPCFARQILVILHIETSNL